MNEKELMQIKTKAVVAAKEAAERIQINTDRARVIFDAIWEVIFDAIWEAVEPELVKYRIEPSLVATLAFFSRDTKRETSSVSSSGRRFA
jgi:hypothetical protein